nr:Asp23/Gls24 family envelope stress response protein [Nesterenkonia sp. YGD6]
MIRHELHDGVITVTTQTQNKPTSGKPGVAAAGSATVVKSEDGGRGSTTIVDNVVEKIIGIATVAVPGVWAVGGGVERAIGSMRDVVGQHNLTQGVSVEVGQTQVAADLNLVVEYPYPLQEVAENVRNAVYGVIQELIGMEVTEVNVVISDIHLPEVADESDDAPESRGSRVS